MGKIYKGWELIKAIEDGEIKNGSRFNIHRTYSAIAVLEEGMLHMENGNKRILTTNDLLIYTFELIQDEIDIDSIEELKGIVEYSTERNTKNQLIQAVKQIDKRVKELGGQKNE